MEVKGRPCRPSLTDRALGPVSAPVGLWSVARGGSVVLGTPSPHPVHGQHRLCCERLEWKGCGRVTPGSRWPQCSAHSPPSSEQRSPGPSCYEKPQVGEIAW